MDVGYSSKTSNNTNHFGDRLDLDHNITTTTTVAAVNGGTMIEDVAMREVSDGVGGEQEMADNDNDDNDNINDSPEWNRLPQEILSKIFSYLTIYEAKAVELTCTAWHRASNVPSLWKRVEFHFDGTDTIRLVVDAFRLMSSKGHLIRDLVVTIGNPGLHQAWMMSGCIQHLLDCISQSPTQFIESFTVNNLVIFTQNRFFKLSKESILNSLNNFLRSRKNLKRVSFISCKFNPGEGLRILRTLKSFRKTLKNLELRHYFKRRYESATRAFKIISTFSELEEISVDANYINDRILQWLTDKRPHCKRLRRLRVYFEAQKPPTTSVSRESWLAARQSCHQDIMVSYHIEGWLAYQWLSPFLIDSVPLVECAICWKRLYRGSWTFYADLTSLLNQLTASSSSLLESFSLYSDVRSYPELEESLVALVSACRRLTDFNISMTLSDHVIGNICGIFQGRNHRVRYHFQPHKNQQSSSCRSSSNHRNRPTSSGYSLRSRGF